ncbi:nuclease-related domain-containing protein [Mycoplasmopsis primatum]|uniref:nuclease-related domain-containing protein n=1 Tax=Mycoplasmopsis primatum TaxID=55604 RepID=UPI000495AFC6|nr:nuclease-related domain-containing protein [Mycoplasmopsis primatum]
MIGLIIAILVTSVILFGILSSIIVFYLKNKKKKTAGFKFEAYIKNKLITYAKNNNYKYLNGGLFKYASNQLFEIDGLLLGNKAVYIIEVKYYNGHIYGDSFSDYLNIKNYKKEIKVKNPLIQNFKHIQHFYKMCNFNIPVFSLLIFPSETTFDIQQQESWSIIANEDKIDQKLKDVEVDMADEQDLSFETLKAVSDAVNLSRTSSIKDIKKFGKIINQNEK